MQRLRSMRSIEPWRRPVARDCKSYTAQSRWHKVGTMDELLTKRRSHPHSVRLCRERIEELAAEASAIIEKTEAENRQPNSREEKRFNEITDESIPGWKHELALAEQFNAALIAKVQQQQPQRVYTPIFQR
jgi:hypothetical protein